MKQASFWRSENQTVICELCPHQCRISEGQRGICQARVNKSGRLIADAYGKVSALALDPVEKKPLYHVKPGKQILSLGSFGCNLKCCFCQNWQISQEKPNNMAEMQISDIVRHAVKSGSCGLAYTYNEPIINIEFVEECAREAQKQRLINVMVSNGYINKAALKMLLPLIDAWNIDLKSMTQIFYENVCRAKLDPVLNTIAEISGNSHLEITHLMVTHSEHSLSHIEALSGYIAGVSRYIPLHLTRYVPQYNYMEEATGVQMMQEALQIAAERLEWVYPGNLDIQGYDTKCSRCKKVLIRRRGYKVIANSLIKEKCPYCAEEFRGIM